MGHLTLHSYESRCLPIHLFGDSSMSPFGWFLWRAPTCALSSECLVLVWRKDEGQRNSSDITETQKYKVRGQLPSGLMYPWISSTWRSTVVTSAKVQVASQEVRGNEDGREGQHLAKERACWGHLDDPIIGLRMRRWYEAYSRA